MEFNATIANITQIRTIPFISPPAAPRNLLAPLMTGSFSTTFMNTIRWQATSSIIHGMTSALSHALGYAKQLNKSLTDIRIVAPEKSIGDMADFAKIANQ